MFSGVDFELETVRRMVETRFPIYETRDSPQGVAFLVTVDPATMDARFDELRIEMVPKNYVPALRKEGGEHMILVQKRPERKVFGTKVNLLLFIVTVASTTLAGALIWSSYMEVDIASASAWGNGVLFFTAPLMAILGIHEMGHYLVAKKYRVAASLPFFIPAPFTLLGTFGAMISMRDPIPNRKALIDIGAAGPVLGLITAIPVTLAGLYLTGLDARLPSPNPGGTYSVNLPLLYTLLAQFVPLPDDVLLHPTAFAGWVGLFVTALNLLPAGQLDGGHVARAVLGDRGRYVSYAAIAAMLVMGFWYQGWLIIAVFILFLGARHPPPLNDLTKLDAGRHALAASVVVVLVLSWVFVPIFAVEPEAGLEFRAVGMPDVGVDVLDVALGNGTAVMFTFLVTNVGNTEANVTLSLNPTWDEEEINLSVSFHDIRTPGDPATWDARNATMVLNSNTTATVVLRVNATGLPPPMSPPAEWDVFVTAQVDAGFRSFERELTITARVS